MPAARKDNVSYMKKWGFKMAMIILIISALNYGAVAVFRAGFFEFILGRGLLARAFYGLIGLCALMIMFDRDTYLPFLGETVMPASVLAERVPAGASLAVKVRVPPGSKVLYWAAEPATDGLEHMNDWREAYQEFENAGVTHADSRGNAILKVRPPQAYTVPFRGRLDPHVHYRVCHPDGMMGRIDTVFLADVGIQNGMGSSAMMNRAAYESFMDIATSPFI
jgi:uncharacterized membrane protein YuzA (DUF378 family)